MFGKFEKRMSGTQMIALGFLLLIFIGTILLMLPVSSRNGEWTPFITALFTSTSATCVTGLVLVDTFTHWSIFGQLVLLVLIQNWWSWFYHHWYYCFFDVTQENRAETAWSY